MVSPAPASSQGAGVADLDLFRVLGRRTQGHGDVIGDLVAGDQDHRGMADRAFGEDRDIGGAAADIHQAHAQFLLVLGQHRIGRGQLLEDDVVDPRPQRRTHFSMFCEAFTAQVTTCTLASRRTPDMPSGSRTPSWLSIT